MMDSVERAICRKQGKIFRLAAGTEYDMGSFVSAYLSSGFCKNAFDASYSRYMAADAEETWERVFPEIENALKPRGDDDPLGGDVAYWTGYMYRAVCILSGASSEDLMSMLPFDEMLRLYPGYHTIDGETAAERIAGSLPLCAREMR